MSTPKSEFLKVILERGYLHQCTDWEGLDALAAKQPVTAYVGFDATADSLHVGHMVQIMLLRRLQQTGHKPIALMGGGTTKVGDPSGKDESRKLLSVEDIERNLESIRQSFSGYLTFGGGKTDAIMVNNADWLDRLNYIEFLRDYGRHFSVNRMLSFDSVKLRLEREQSLSFLEFNYMILQAYDFLELARRYDCRLQMGGSDQWGNIVNGTELGRRIDNRELFGLTAPLITTASGAKMGKTAAGAVWLNPSRLSPYDYWQYWRNTEDSDVGRFLRLFTDVPMEEIARLEKLEGAEINEAKIVLANEATTLCHGAAAARNAAETARRTFVEGGLGADLPTTHVDLSELEFGIFLHEALRMTELASSNGEGRRKISEGGVKVNDKKIGDANYRLSTCDLNDGRVIKLSLGTKRHAILRVGADDGPKTVLLVKRNNELREQIRNRLGEMGYLTLATTNAAFALKYLERPCTIRVACVDFTMPGNMNGALFRGRARHLASNLRFVMLLNKGTDAESAVNELGSASDTSIVRRDDRYTSIEIAREIVRLLESK